MTEKQSTGHDDAHNIAQTHESALTSFTPLGPSKTSIMGGITGKINGIITEDQKRRVATVPPRHEYAPADRRC